MMRWHSTDRDTRSDCDAGTERDTEKHHGIRRAGLTAADPFRDTKSTELNAPGPAGFPYTLCTKNGDGQNLTGGFFAALRRFCVRRHVRGFRAARRLAAVNAFGMSCDSFDTWTDAAGTIGKGSDPKVCGQVDAWRALWRASHRRRLRCIGGEFVVWPFAG